MQDKINQILYRPFIFDKEDANKVVVIIGSDIQISTGLNLTGDSVRNKMYIIYILDVTETVYNVKTTFDSWILNDVDKFIEEHLVAIDDPNKFAGEFLSCHAIMLQEFGMIGDKARNISRAINVFRKMALDNAKPSNNKMQFDKPAGIYNHTVFGVLDGLPQDLDKDKIDAIGGSIMELVIQNIGTDLQNDEQVERIKTDLEARIIEVLPENIDIKKLTINHDKVLEDIKAFDIDYDFSEDLGDLNE